MSDETPESNVVPDVVPDVTPDQVVEDAPVPVPEPKHDDDRVGHLEGIVSRLEEAVTDLSNKVSGLAPVPVVDPEPEEMDSAPTKKPWTHRGFGKRDD